MQITTLTLQSKLPLTCARIGTCCHGNQVLLNPYELFCIAREKKISPKEFRDLYTHFGGIRLRFNGKVNSKQKQACSQYIDNFGCSVHLGRPLACRLFPLGRQVQNNEVSYMHQGNEFPCLDGCSEVLTLPLLSVGEYLKDQQTEAFETAQDSYLQVMQTIADLAFELLLDTGLAASGDKKTLALWRKMSNEAPENLVKTIGQEWMDALMIPEIADDAHQNSLAFVQKHLELLHQKAQYKFGALQTFEALSEASVLLMAVALHLARALGANPQTLANHWIDAAKQHGAQE